MNSASSITKRHRKGFGLAELLITLSVISVLTALAAPMIGLLKSNASESKSIRNAQHLSQLAATAIAAGDESIPSAGSVDAAVQLLVDGVSVDDVLSGMVFQLDLSDTDAASAKEHLKYEEGNLIFIEKLNERK